MRQTEVADSRNNSRDVFANLDVASQQHKTLAKLLTISFHARESTAAVPSLCHPDEKAAFTQNDSRLLEDLLNSWAKQTMFPKGSKLF